MKVFNKEIEGCLRCIYTSNINGISVCAYDDRFKEMFKLNDRIFDKDKGHYVQEIHKDCPFNKSLTKEDFESFRFLFNPTINKYQKKITDNIYFLKFHNDIFCDITMLQKGEGYIEPLFSGNITSKPHLEFILQLLNII